MVGYGVSKAACHHLVSTLAHPDSGLPKNGTYIAYYHDFNLVFKVTVTAIMPVTLDTPANRAAMPNADFTNWTPLETVAQLLLDWANGKNAPKNGALINIEIRS
jgi:dihydropteridine reductase